MKNIIKVLLVYFFTFGLTHIYSQNSILIPSSESCIRLMNPGLSGLDCKNRLTVNQLFESHPINNIHSFKLTYDFDIPKYGLFTGFQYSTDRVGTKNLASSFQLNLGYELKLNQQISIIYSYHFSYDKLLIEEATYFNRFNYNDTLINNVLGVSEKNYFENSVGMIIKGNRFIGGIHQRISSSNVGQFNGFNLYSKPNLNAFFGLNFPLEKGKINTYLAYSNNKSLAQNLNLKFPKISCYNISVNYQSEKNWFTGIGVRIIENHPTMYHSQAGLKFEKYQLSYGFGITPYKNNESSLKMAFTSQATLEYYLKRRKSYHKPTYTYEIEKFPDNSIKKDLIFMDGVLISHYEYFENGEDKLVKNYRNGLLDGIYSEGNIDGWTIVSGKYKKGLKHGSWKYCNEKGDRIRYEKYNMGELIEKTDFQPEDYKR